MLPRIVSVAYNRCGNKRSLIGVVVPGPIPDNPKIYHIVHVDRLASISVDRLWCDAEVVRRAPPGTTIGMSAIKQRRLSELTLTSHPGLFVGECVPFYFCPRSIMLYLIYQGNHPDLCIQRRGKVRLFI